MLSHTTCPNCDGDFIIETDTCTECGYGVNP